LVINALVAADGVVVPCMPAFLDAESLDLMVKQVSKIRKRKLNSDLRILSIVFTKVEPRAVVDRDFMEAIRERYPDIPICSHVIPRTEAVKQAQAQRLTVLEYQPNSAVAHAYRGVAQEVWHGVTA
jgi:chromosome partitioning protein